MSAARCPRCGRELAESAELARQAEAVRAAVEGCVAREFDARRALRGALNRAADLALDHARATACAAGTCIAPAPTDEAMPFRQRLGELRRRVTERFTPPRPPPPRHWADGRDDDE